MLAKRIIPVLILENGNVVESHGFRLTNAVHTSAAGALRAMSTDDADEIIVLDVSRDRSQRDAFYVAFDAIGNLARCPITAGGWIDSLAEADRLFSMGADKVTVNTACKDNPREVRRIIRKYGKQAVVASVDIRRGLWMVDRGRRVAGHMADAIEAVKDCGEVLLTDIDHEGTALGYNPWLIEAFAEELPIPIIAFGGVSHWDHMLEGLNAGASAVSAANCLHYSEGSVRSARAWLKGKGAWVR